MDVRYVLAASATMQLGILILVLALIRITGRKVAWLTIALAIAFVLSRSVWALSQAIQNLPPGTLAPQSRWMGLMITALMLAGFILLIPLFRSIRRSETAQREAEQRFRQLAEASFEGIVVHEAGQVLDVNPALTEMLGYTREEMIGGSAVDFIAADSRERVEKYIRESHDRPYEHNVLCKDGRMLRVEARGKSTSYNGRTVRVTALRDVTERKAAQEHLRRAHEELEARVRERTAELERVNQNLRYEVEERARVEAALIHTTRELTDFVENASIGLQWVDPDGRILWANKAELELLGFTREEYIGRPVVDFHVDQDAVREFLERLARRESFHEYEVRLRCKDESIKYVQISSNVLTENGKLVHTRCFTRDVTEQKLTEKALDERMRLSALAGDIGVALTNEKDLPGMLRRAAEAVVRHLDAAFARIWTHNVKDNMLELQASAGMYTHLDGPHSRVPVGALKIGRISLERKPHLTNQVVGDPEISDQEWAKREGMVAFAGYPLTIGDRLVGVMAMFARKAVSAATTDAMAAVADAIALGIDRHQAEAGRFQTERQLQAVLDKSTAVIYLKDRAGRYMLVNRHFSELFHITLDQLRGKTDHDLFPKEAADAFRGNDLKVIAAREPIEFEEVAPHDDGPHTYISLKFPLFDAAGVPYAVCGISTDITERKRQAEELTRAKNTAEAASRAKSVFLANISHEIRTPITAMLGAAELVAGETGDRPAVGDRMNMILRNGRHLLALIDDLLDASRAEAGTLQIRRVPCSLREILADVKAVVQPLCRRPEVEFRIIYDTPVPAKIMTDPTRLKQGLINLVNNALKFTERGHVWIRVSTEQRSDDSRLILRVEDTGVGIPASERERIFEPFAQIAAGGSRAAEGSGLGLPLARWIAEQLGGALHVEGTEYQGSTFTLSVSTGSLDGVLWIAPGTVDESLDSPAVKPAESSTLRLSGRVLLAEDFDDTRALVERALVDHGVEVTAVAGGEQAVVEGGSASFDLVLMDLRMPGMDGITATRELRRRGCLAPIIALTASISADDREALTRAGFDDVWAKPMTLESLVERTAAYLPTATDVAGTPAPGVAPPPMRDYGSKGKLIAVSARFVENLPPRITSLTEAVQSGRTEDADEILHQLIGSGGIHGFMDISREAARLLALVRGGRMSGKTDELQPLKELVRRALASSNETFRAGDGG